MNLTDLPYALRPMAIEDIPTVSAIEQIIFSLPWSATAFRYEISHNAASQYLTLRYLPWVGAPPKRSLLSPVRRLLHPPRLDSSLLGYGGFWLMVDEAHICTLALRPEWRRRGLGELLLVSLIEVALGCHAQVVTLEVRVSNTVAQSLYRKYEFKKTGRHKRYYSDNGEDAYVMTMESINSTGYRNRFRELTARLREQLLTQPGLPPTEAYGNRPIVEINHVLRKR